jgi:hypothetical protein
MPSAICTRTCATTATRQLPALLYLLQPVHRRHDDPGQRQQLPDAVRRLGRRGLCSYLLIGFWFDKGKDGIGNALAGQESLRRQPHRRLRLAHRCLFLMFWTFGSLTFDEVFAQVDEVAQASRVSSCNHPVHAAGGDR